MKGSLRTELFGALVDRNVTLVAIEARGSSIVTKWRITGRNDRGIPKLGIPPNGRRLDVEAITVDSLIDGVPRRFSMVDLSRVIDQGGHFAAMEIPDLLVRDLGDYFRRFR